MTSIVSTLVYFVNMVAHLESNVLLCDKHHGFWSGKSTQLLRHFYGIMESLGNNADIDAIYLDFTKAFHKFDHKLRTYS